MQTTINMMRKTLLLCLALSFFMALSLTGKAADNEIVIDNNTHCLKIAGESFSGYTWYKNDKLLTGELKEKLKVKESGAYTVMYKNRSGKIVKHKITILINQAGTIIKIYLIGDSTVSNYAASKYPMTGWGQLLQSFFNTTNIQVDNRAIGGRSSRSYFIQGRWTPVRDALKAGDYVFIQFGHNDRNSADTSRFTSVADYKKYLTIYCKDARAKGAIPVLVSPMVMNAWRGTTMRNVFTETGNDYRGGMLEVANTLNVAFVDLNMKSWNLYKSFGVVYDTRFIYNTYLAGEYPNYPNGLNDGTHFQEMGSISNARMITDGIRELSARADMANLISNLKPQFKVTIGVNPAGADSLTTKTASYPQGVTITLKTLHKAKSVFQRWNNASGTQISTATIFTVPSGTTTSFTAVYRVNAIASFANPNRNLPTEVLSPLNLSIAPNPVSDRLILQGKDLDGGLVKIVDAHGRVVYQKASSTFISVAALPAGIYNLIWTKGKEQVVKAFVVTKQ